MSWQLCMLQAIREAGLLWCLMPVSSFDKFRCALQPRQQTAVLSFRSAGLGLGFTHRAAMRPRIPCPFYDAYMHLDVVGACVYRFNVNNIDKDFHEQQLESFQSIALYLTLSGSSCMVCFIYSYIAYSLIFCDRCMPQQPQTGPGTY